MNRSLNGLRVLNTRPKNQAHALSQQIIAAGGIAIECPTLEIRATDNDWVQSLPNLSTVHLALFVSANAVHHCFKQLSQQNINWPPQIKVIAIGQASADALKQYNILVSETPLFPNSENLLELNSLHQLNNQTVLLFKGEGGRQLIEEHLQLRGARLLPQLVYKRMLPESNHQLIRKLWQDDLVDIILVTSEQSLQHLFKIFAKEAHHWLQAKPYLVISERLAKSASLFGINELVITHPEQMINTLLDYSQGLIHGQ